ncbi:hypothetical protein [Clostridium ihumii]|uniref:hypothetical protein n=1 Tax=Clostridium ihumii TaxID=1470356 RepID=UPI00054D6736|nr:hypothetical protein [Clostridium ihumii]
MSVQAKIHCINCDNDYYVYERNLSRNQIMNCPHCDCVMDETMWHSICDAIGSVMDINYHFLKYHNERNEDLFQVSIENCYVPLNKFKK